MSRLRDRDYFDNHQISFNFKEKPTGYLPHICRNDALENKTGTKQPLLFEYKKRPYKKKQKSEYNLNYVVFTLVVIFSIASWIDMVGVFAELPLMVPVLPEGWNLSVYFCLSIEIPFLAPVVIYILIFVKPSIISFRAAILFIIVIGILSLALLAKVWSKTIYVSGTERSVPLLTLVTALGLVDSCSTVVFYPYMKRFHPRYMFAVLIGESLTGFIPAFMKLIQGGAEPFCSKYVNNSIMESQSNDTFLSNEQYSKPRFSVAVYFTILSIIMTICLVAFLLLELSPTLRKEQLRKSTGSGQIIKYDGSIIQTMSKDEAMIDRRKLTKVEYANFMFIMGISAFVLWGLISAFYTYSILPFGFKVTNNAIIITNAIRFSSVYFAYKRPIEKVMYINFIMVLLFCISMYMLFCAVYSPCPPLIETKIGAFIAAFCLIAVDYFSTYMRSCVIRRISYHGGNILVTCAMVTKTGVLLGAIVSTILVQKTNLFLARRFCSPLSEQCHGYRAKFLPVN